MARKSRFVRPVLKYKNLLILECALLLSACVPSAGSDVELEGTHWELQRMEGQGVLADTFISLELEGGKVTGTAGCNMYGADYTTQPKGGMSINTPERTEEDCQEPEGVMEQEERYFQVIGEVAGYRVEGDNLTLMDQRGKAYLEYGRIPEYDVEPGDLLGKNWVLTSATGLEGADLGVFTIRFLGDEFRGATICRDYAGAYQAEGDEIRVTYLEMITESGCDEEKFKIEGEYTTLLENASQYNVTEAHLELFTRRGKTLIYELVPGGKLFSIQPS